MPVELVELSTVMASAPHWMASEALAEPKGAVTVETQVPQTADEELLTAPATHLDEPARVAGPALRVLAPQHDPAVALQSLLSVQAAPRAVV